MSKRNHFPYELADLATLFGGARSSSPDQTSSLPSSHNTRTDQGQSVFDLIATLFNSGTRDSETSSSADPFQHLLDFVSTTPQNRISGTSAHDVLTGQTGHDAMFGLDGDDTLSGLEGNDRLDGGRGADTLIGGDGNDSLQGGSGDDSMAGGLGDDTYFVGESGDKVTEAASAGTDTVHAAISYTLTANVENLHLTGTGNLAGTGNELANTLTGNRGANELYGLEGNDVLFGDRGNDVLAGGLGNDKLDGGSGNDEILGGAGTDILTGGKGSDTFVFLSAPDSTAGSGHDTITDFSVRRDHIDLSAIDADTAATGDQHFTFIGADSFSHKAGELHFNAATHLLSGDTNGGAIADFEIALTGVTSLTSSVFEL